MLRKLLNGLFDADIPLGIEISQQTRFKNSIPDGYISQDPFSIMIETKVDAGINETQLFNHMESLHSKEGSYLLLLTKDDVDVSTLSKVIEHAKNEKIIFRHYTFESLCEDIKGIVPDYELQLKPIIEDYELFCNDTGLLPDRRKWMRIVHCGQTIELNEKYSLYYQPSTRGYSKHQYVGIYNQKAVRFIGKTATVIDCSYVNNQLQKNYVDGDVSNQFDDKIIGMINESMETLGWDIATGLRFFCFDNVYQTFYEKTSPYGIYGARFHDVSEYTSENSSAAYLAKVLESKTWE